MSTAGSLLTLLAVTFLPEDQFKSGETGFSTREQIHRAA